MWLGGGVWVKWKGSAVTVGVIILLGIIYMNHINTTVIYDYAAPNHTVETASLTADTVLIGSVELIDKARWNSKDGKWHNKIIFRPTTIKVDEYLKNPLKDNHISIINMGGRIGFHTVKFMYTQQQTFKQGQKVILFLRKDIDPGDGILYYEPILSFEIKGDIAINTVTGMSMPIQILKSEIIGTKH